MRGAIRAACATWALFVAASASAQTRSGYPPPGYPPPGYPPYPPGPYYPPGYAPPGYKPRADQPPGYPPPGYPPGAYGPPGYAPWAAPRLQPPGPRKPDLTSRFHDSFYLRMSMGIGYLGAHQTFEPPPAVIGSSTPALPSSELGVSGWTTSFDIAAGGTPIPGFVVGGAFIFNSAAEPTVSLGDTSVTSNYSFVFWMPAMFIDIFPDPKRGFHFGAIGGIAAVDWERTGPGSDATGVGGGAFVGYDAWVGNQWSLGGLVRALGAGVNDGDANGKTKFGVGSIAVLATALYH